MIRAPAFWNRDGILAHALSPFAAIIGRIASRRAARPGWRSPVPVLCCGNATVGGAGKTTVARDLVRRLQARGLSVHVLSRGYGGSARGPRRVMAGDTVAVTGDEALLLAADAPTWTGADRAASARAAIAAGADVIVMDDGLQNASLDKTMSLLIVDAATGFGNGRVLPAGPLREPVASAAARCRAAILIGPARAPVSPFLPARLRVLRARLEQGENVSTLVGQRVVAFTGIAFPAKFFDGLAAAGVDLADRLPFPDHHVFSASDRAMLRERARSMDAILVTTPKDAVRLPPDIQVSVVDVSLVWENTPEIEALLDELMSGAIGHSRSSPVHGMSRS